VPCPDLRTAGCGENLFLSRNQEVNGYFAFTLGDTVPPNAGQKLQATLLLSDELDRSYPYSLRLDNSQCIAGNGDEYCRFHSAAQVRTEIGQREAERRVSDASRAAAGDPNFGALVDKLIAKRFPPKPVTVRQSAQVEGPSR